MKFVEKKISLVGWGEMQVLLHSCNGHPGFSVFDRNRLTLFGMAPWLKDRVIVLPTTAKYQHGTPPAPEHVDVILEARRRAVAQAVEALYTQDIDLLGLAVTATYAAQRFMGAQPLPELGEIGRRFSGKFGVYLFKNPSAIGKNLRNDSVLVA